MNTFTPLYNYGYIVDDVPANILDELKKETDYIQSDFTKHLRYNPLLAGRIENEYFLEKTNLIEPYVIELCKDLHNKTFPNYDGPSPRFKFSNNRSGKSDLWVNFQKKYEYNPRHSHSGFFSFVIWLKVPFNLEDEMNVKSNKEANTSSPGFNFSFVDHCIPGGISTKYIPVDKKYEGKICIFPAWLNHNVDPFFTSDDYRISISGNIDALPQ